MCAHLTRVACSDLSQTSNTFKNAREMNQKIDQLPGYGSWKFKFISVGESTTKHEVFYRNPIDCLRAVLGDPAFKDYISYAPEKHYAEATRTTRMYTDMKTGDFWFEVQVRLHS